MFDPNKVIEGKAWDAEVVHFTGRLRRVAKVEDVDDINDICSDAAINYTKTFPVKCSSSPSPTEKGSSPLWAVAKRGTRTQSFSYDLLRTVLWYP